MAMNGLPLAKSLKRTSWNFPLRWRSHAFQERQRSFQSKSILEVILWNYTRKLWLHDPDLTNISDYRIPGGQSVINIDRPSRRRSQPEDFEDNGNRGASDNLESRKRAQHLRIEQAALAFSPIICMTNTPPRTPEDRSQE